MQLPEIIGIAGTNGAGKDTLADLRFEQKGALKVSLSDILRVEATKRGLGHDRENLRMISTEWGRKFGAAALSVMTLENYWETQTDERTGLSIVSIRRPAEAKVIQDNNGMIFWIDADRRTRYNRVKDGKRGRAEDMVSYEEFCADEDAELYPGSKDPFLVNMSAVRAMADERILNDFSSELEYEKYLLDTYTV